MRSTVRWMLAGVVTAAVFSATLWVSAAMVLPLWIKSDSDRWVVAASLSVALAAVAALWGAAFAQRADRPDAAGVESKQATTPFLAEPNPTMTPASAPAGDQPNPAETKPEATPAPASASQVGTSVTMHGEASGHGRVYQAGHDQIINEK